MEGLWIIKLMVVCFSPTGGRCYSGQWIPGIAVGYEKKTILHSLREVVVQFVFRKLKLVCERWEWVSALRLKSKPWWVTIPGL